MKTVVIIQARMGSTRLPGKVLKKVIGKTVLEHVIDRVIKSKEVDEIVIATTDRLEDEAIVKEAIRLGVKFYRGSEDDVLGRYYNAAKENNAAIVIRITSDCPLIDPIIMDNMIKVYKSNSCDYISNTISRTYPRGLDCEVFSFQVLEQAFNNTTENYQREHVTPYIYENKQLFDIKQYLDEEDNSDLRCTLDTQEDYEVITKTLELVQTNYTYSDLLHVLRSNPDIIEINSKIVQKDMRG